MPMKLSSGCRIMACAMPLVLPFGIAAQVVDDSHVLTPGLHSLSLPRSGEPAIHYAISIPRNYSRSTPVPQVLEGRASRLSAPHP